jgi:prophage regulatory protein
MANQAFFRLAEIVGDKRRGINPQIPVSTGTWWSWVREGKAPAPVKLAPRVTAWRARDVEAFIAKLGGQ